MRLTFTEGTDAGPGAIVLADTRGRADQMVALGTSEMDLMSDKILWAKLGSVSGGFQRGAGGGSCGTEKESTKEKADHMWSKPSDILWHSLPGDIHVSLRSAEPSWERKVQMPHLQSTSTGTAICTRQIFSSSQMLCCVACPGKFNPYIIYKLIALHNIMNGLHVRVLWELHGSSNWRDCEKMCPIFSPSHLKLKILYDESVMHSQACIMSSSCL